MRLHQILALKFLGFSLDEVRAFLCGPKDSAAESLRLQKDMLMQKRDHLDRVIHSADHARVVFQDMPEPDWSHVINVIHALQMGKKYCSDEAKIVMEERLKTYFRKDAERDGARWHAVLSGFR